MNKNVQQMNKSVQQMNKNVQQMNKIPTLLLKIIIWKKMRKMRALICATQTPSTTLLLKNY